MLQPQSLDFINSILISRMREADQKMLASLHKKHGLTDAVKAIDKVQAKRCDTPREEERGSLPGAPPPVTYNSCRYSSGWDRRLEGAMLEAYSGYCGRDKGMPKGWSFSWESMATREKGKPRDALYGKLACCLCATCVFAISNRCQKTVLVPIRG